MNTEQIKEHLLGSPLAPEAEAILATLRPSIRLTARQLAMDMFALGGSRFGGVPDLPDGMSWPVQAGRRLEFLAQIDLWEAAKVTPLPGMPQEGWLTFFYDAEKQPWGFDPKDAGGWRVLFFSGEPTSLRRADVEPAFPPCMLHMEYESCLPDVFDSTVGVEMESPERRFLYGELRDEIQASEEEIEHRLGGLPTLVQDDMRLQCQLASNEVHCGGPLDGKDPLLETLSPGAADWDLLLQIDTDEDEPGWMWGDVGKIYYWLRRQDLEARAFHKAWLVLQCG